MALKRKKAVKKKKNPFEKGTFDITKGVDFGVDRRGKTIKILPPTGTSNTLRDASRRAKLPGKRISKTGKEYYETRVNRSDKLFSKV